MGVKGLWSLCAPVGREISVESLEHTTLAIDVSIWLIQFLKAMRNDEGRAIRHAHLLGTLRRVCKLLFHGIRPIFVFDGGVPVAKARLIRKRQQGRAQDSNRAQAAAQKLYARQQLLSEQRQKKQSPQFDAGAQRAESAHDSESDQNVEWIGIESSEDEEDEEFDYLPERFDPGVFSSIGLDRRKIAVEKATQRLRVEARQKKLLPVSNDPNTYSQNQLSCFLNLAKFTKRVQDAQRASEKQHDAIGGSRIHSDGTKRYLLLRDDDDEKITDSSQRQDLALRSSSKATRKMQHFLTANARSSARNHTSKKRKTKHNHIFHQDMIEMRRLNEEQELNDFGHSSHDSSDKNDFPDDEDIHPKDILQPIKRKRTHMTGHKQQNQSNATPDSSEHLLLQKPTRKRQQHQPIYHEDMMEMRRLNEEQELNNFGDSSDDSSENGSKQNGSSNEDMEGGFMTKKMIAEVEGSRKSNDQDKGSHSDRDDVSRHHDDDDQASGGFLHPHEMSLSPEMETSHSPEESHNQDKGSHYEQDDVSRDDDDDQASGGFLHLDESNLNSGSRQSRQSPTPSKLLASDDDDDCRWEAAQVENDHKSDEKSSASEKDCAWEEDASAEADESDDDGVAIKISIPTSQSAAIQMRLHEMFGDVPRTQLEASNHEANLEVKDNNGLEAQDYQIAAKEIRRKEKARRIISEVSDDDESIEATKNNQAAPNSVEVFSQTAQEETQVDALISEENGLSPQSLEVTGREADRIPTAIDLVEADKSDESVEEAIAMPEWPTDEDPTVVAKREGFYDVCPTFDEQLAYAVDNASGADLAGLSAAADAEVDERTKRALQYVIWSVKTQLAKEEGTRVQAAEQAKLLEQKRRVEEERDNVLSAEHAKAIEEEMVDLRREVRNKQRDAEHVTEEMRQSVMNLLDMLGFPYVVAPMEAEAQCVYLEKIGAVEGVVTDDSDALVFGAKRVYKNIFSDKNNVEAYYTSDLLKELKLEHRDLVAYALLLGGDYAEGVKNVGIVNAAEILVAFRRDADVRATETLRRFKKWLDGHDLDPESEANPDVFPQFAKSKKNARLYWQAPPGFPSTEAEEQYLRPSVAELSELIRRPTTWGGKSRTSGRGLFDDDGGNDYMDDNEALAKHPRRLFKWSNPNEERLTAWCKDILGWQDEKIISSLQPAINKHKERMSKPRDTRLDAYYDSYHSNKRVALVQSRRLRKALNLPTLPEHESSKTKKNQLAKKPSSKAKKKRTRKSASVNGQDVFELDDSIDDDDEEVEEQVEEEVEKDYVDDDDEEFDGTDEDMPDASPYSISEEKRAVIIVPVGLPGSGKSSFYENHLAEHSSAHRCCQDVLKTLKKVQDAVNSLALDANFIYVDRTNVSEKQRKYWINIAKQHSAAVVALFFDVDVSTCIERASKRKNHEGRIDERDPAQCRKVVSILARQLTPVAQNEGFDAIFTIPSSPSEKTELARKLVEFHKRQKADASHKEIDEDLAAM